MTETKTCEYCGKEYTPAPTHINRQKYCSRKCKKKASYERTREKNKRKMAVKTRRKSGEDGYPQVCQFCGETFLYPLPRVYCSPRCRRASNMVRLFFENVENEPVRYTEEQLEYLKRKSRMNMIHFFRDKLVKILDGKTPREVLSSTERKALRRNSILISIGGKRGPYELTSFARKKLLEALT